MAGGLTSGLLWYDSDPKTGLTAKLERAAARYRQKFGQYPNTCFVHPAALEREIEWQGIRVAAAPNVPPHHLWLGVANHSPREA